MSWSLRCLWIYALGFNVMHTMVLKANIEMSTMLKWFVFGRTERCDLSLVQELSVRF
jgi:hypothetical protein